MSSYKVSVSKENFFAIIVHAIFIGVCVPILLLPLQIGLKLFFLGIIYDIIIICVAVWKKYTTWLRIWLFAAILSVFMIFPDWYLSEQLQVLIFPDDGLFKIGSVSGYMLFLWTIPIFTIIYSGLQLEKTYTSSVSYLLVALLSLVIFAGAEQTLWIIGSWYAVNVQMLGKIAIYIIIPEILLGLFSFWVYRHINEKILINTVLFTFTVMIFYLGSANLFYFIFETLIFS